VCRQSRILCKVCEFLSYLKLFLFLFTTRGYLQELDLISNYDSSDLLFVLVITEVLVECMNVCRGAHNKEMLIKELDRLGVSCDVRHLQVGDFLWIAQHITGATIDATVFQFNFSEI